MFLDYLSLTIMIIVFLILVYAAIYIHDIPYEMARERGHPHQDAIHVGGWLSLFTLHAIWPLLWIWANLYKPGVGYGFHLDKPDPAEPKAIDSELSTMRQTISDLQYRVRILESQPAGEASHD